MTIDDRQMALGRLYARSMLDVAAERGEEEALGEELNALAEAVSLVPEFAAFAASPLVDDDERQRAWDRILRGRVSDLLADSLAVIAERQRLGALPAIVAAYNQGLRDRRGVIDAEVVSAVALTDDLRQALVKALARHTGKTAEISERVDPKLLGGLVVRTGDEKIDGSVATRLSRLASRLSARASEELIQGHTFYNGEATD